jgi:DNA-binding transcriptional LysR family regulator
MADRRLQVFHAVAKHLSFTKAAEALFMTQPAVTSQIRQFAKQKLGDMPLAEVKSARASRRAAGTICSRTG